ncbi:co-chaperone GroES [Helicobacter sp. MIT 03-1614]|jgi:chaperonin GroES|uniref:Co-chaperonin GroES n=1 Tax=Helicobacter hepaticus (strain ATCC 51449 / 3B1) TaxID=235279 RepID=CH10_HELHP|nr:RecName: Full=Co-chaperonin GroES; AltName: Full=10 kDa chaperonin; AltName: Full=Chaperonin-10; Short=Cpn10 [Helicobacter hepaticus ATCC 51449]AAP77797.1 chaperone protein HspA (GroES/HSP10 family) [Helicobacter hepaticus ATCC 51449]TLD90880.1 co-chaperone GroES [Helicobacter sp. MIT 03-1614]
MKFRPLGERVLVERVEEDTKTSSGIIIPDNAKEKPLMGIVKAVSAKIKDDKILKENDKVVFGKYKGAEIKLDSKEFIVLELDDILGVIEK